MFMLFAGNKNDSLDFTSMCKHKSWESEEVEYSVTSDMKGMDFCFIIDGEDGSVYRDFKVVDWNNRDAARTPEEAAKVVANKLNSLSVRNPNQDTLKELEVYAQSKGIPFSASIHTKFLANFNNENPMWDSSSASC